MTYRNMPVAVDKQVDNGEPILATKVTVDFSTKNQIKRQLGANIDAGDQLRFNGDVDCKISVDFILQANHLGTDFLFDTYNNTGQNSMTLDIGSDQYQSCFIDNFTFSVKPFQPVVGRATFSSYNPSSAILLGIDGDETDSHLNTEDVIYGHHCSMANAGDVVASNIINDFVYTKTYSRTPIYTLGSQQATSQIVDGVEVNVNVQSTGLHELIDFSGNKLNNIFNNNCLSTIFFKSIFPFIIRVLNISINLSLYNTFIVFAYFKNTDSEK